jgi:hypothetical protein
MKIFTLLILILIIPFITFSAKIGSLTEVFKPDNITISNDKLFIVEGATISVYSLKDLSLKSKFGRKGEGPGELKILPGMYLNRVTVCPEFILVESIDKISFFSIQGKFLNELKKNSMQMMKTTPVGKNFVTEKLMQGKDGTTLITGVLLLNSELKEIKQLYSQKYIQQGRPPSISMQMVMDFANFRVFNDQIFIERSPQGFFIDVFDSEGNKLRQITMDYKQVKVTDKDKVEIMNKFQEEPTIKMQSKSMGGWNTFKKIFNFVFSEFYPPIQDFEVTGNKIFIKTFNVNGEKEEILVTDLNGKFLKKLFLPKYEYTTLLSKRMAAIMQVIHQNKCYYLLENEDNEEWELHRINLK